MTPDRLRAITTTLKWATQAARYESVRAALEELEEWADEMEALEKRTVTITGRASATIPRLPYRVYSGSEKFDYGDKHISALCQSPEQADALIKAMWPGSGYWEKD